MKSNLRILSALAAICMLLACVLGCTSCTDELLTSMSELEGVLSQNLTETTEPTTTETEESTSDISQEPVTLPGEDTLSHDCEHAYGEWLEATPPGCETEGLCYRLCDICNGREEKAIDATGHTEEPMEPIAATCTLQGSKDGVQCAVCEEILVIPTVVLPIGHPSYNNGICIACGSPKHSAEGLAYLDIYNQSYGYEYLGTMENGEALQALYRELDTAVRAFHTDPSLEAREVKESDPIACTVNYGELGLSHEEAQAVWKTYRDDHPLYYWISNSVSYGETSKKLNLLAVPEFAHGSARLQTNQELYQSIAAYLSKIPESSTDYEIALLMYNALIDAIDYAYDENDQPETEAWAHSILGVFQGRGAVCEGYARAYQLLLNFNGVNCLFVTGESQGEAHAWNVIELDGEWYGVDATWDDNGSEGYSYFCISDAQFYATHTKDLPTDTGLNFLYEVPQLQHPVGGSLPERNARRTLYLH